MHAWALPMFGLPIIAPRDGRGDRWPGRTRATASLGTRSFRECAVPHTQYCLHSIHLSNPFKADAHQVRAGYLTLITCCYCLNWSTEVATIATKLSTVIACPPHLFVVHDTLRRNCHSINHTAPKISPVDLARHHHPHGGRRPKAQAHI
jgi:hypothetical protein